MSKRNRSTNAEQLTGLVITLPIPEVTADNDEIVRLASLTRKAVTNQEQAELDRASDFDRILVAVAACLLGGRAFSVCSDSPKTLDRTRSLAQHLGASVQTEFYDAVVGKPVIVFDPPSRQ
jgi:hypothetical protein